MNEKVKLKLNELGYKFIKQDKVYFKRTYIDSNVTCTGVPFVFFRRIYLNYTNISKSYYTVEAEINFEATNKEIIKEFNERYLKEMDLVAEELREVITTSYSPKERIDEIIDDVLNCGADEVDIDECWSYKSLVKDLEILEILRDHLTTKVLYGYDSPNQICWLDDKGKRIILIEGDKYYKEIKEWLDRKGENGNE